MSTVFLTYVNGVTSNSFSYFSLNYVFTIHPHVKSIASAAYYSIVYTPHFLPHHSTATPTLGHNKYTSPYILA